jgi:NADH dehydrogenase (ubiquinone) 1 alpha/beta subcomplex 1, acyl-carrier protein
MMNTLVSFSRMVVRGGVAQNSLRRTTMCRPRYYAAQAGLQQDDVRDRVIKIVQQFDKVDETKVNAESHFINDLGLDSLDAVELVMALEGMQEKFLEKKKKRKKKKIMRKLTDLPLCLIDEFAVEVPETDLENLVSVEAAIAYVLSNPNAK